jgi:hypothetical protein
MNILEAKLNSIPEEALGPASASASPTAFPSGTHLANAYGAHSSYALAGAALYSERRCWRAAAASAATR